MERLRQIKKAVKIPVIGSLNGFSTGGWIDYAQKIEQAEGKPGPCLLMLDIDHFKRLNDTYGHLFGDRVLASLGQLLKANVKGRDTAARYGGEEFAVLLPETPLKGAIGLAEILRRLIAGGRVKRIDRDETIGNITVSIGVAEFHAGEPAAELIGRADQALYASKAQGRNRVTSAEDVGDDVASRAVA